MLAWKLWPIVGAGWLALFGAGACYDIRLGNVDLEDGGTDAPEEDAPDPDDAPEDLAADLEDDAADGPLDDVDPGDSGSYDVADAPEAPVDGPPIEGGMPDLGVDDGGPLDLPVSESRDTVPPDADSGARDGGPCTFGPFSTPVRVDVGLPAQLWGPSPSADALVLYFARTQSVANEDVWVATRPDRSSPFSGATAVAAANTGSQDGTPFISADGLTLYFFSNRAGGVGNRDIWYVTRTSPQGTFSNPRNLTGVNGSATDHLPSLTPDGLVIFFSSTRSGGAGSGDIWTATRTSTTANFGAPVNLQAVNTNSSESGAFIAADGLTLFLESARGGNPDLYMATRTSTTSPFSTPVALTTVSSTSADQDPAITSDGTELFFSSNRGGSQELWRSTRSCM